MKIVLSGIETNNKGAELMLYAILQEIERKYPNADVYVPIFAVKQGLEYVNTKVNLRNKPWACLAKSCKKLHIPGILRRLGITIPMLNDSKAISGADYFLDASGFLFSDQWAPREKHWQTILSGYHKQKTKIVFLPQAFGPVEKQNTKRVIALLEKYTDMVMPREEVSLKYLRQCKFSEKKLQLFGDFTSLVEGVFPKQHEHLKDGVCVIPNLRMIDKGMITLDDYLKILARIIESSMDNGRKVYLLNHEGEGDEKLAYLCRERLNNRVEVVSGLNALEVKGLIATSYLCISSRFHGVASALNSGVPCLATSWSHKYGELFKDYGQSDCILDLGNINACISKVTTYLKEENNKEIREKLHEALPEIKDNTKRMWNLIWGYGQ